MQLSRLLALPINCMFLTSAILLYFYREAFNGCYPNVEEFINCATTDKPPSEKDIFRTKITYMQRGFHQEDITLNCRKVCKEIAAATSRHIQHVRINYEGKF